MSKDLEIAEPLLRPGGRVIADNVLHPGAAPLCVRREGQIQPPGTLDSLWFYDVLYGSLKFLNPKHLKIIQQ